MAALDLPWLESMSSSSRDANDGTPAQSIGSAEPPTYAAFSPATLGHPTIAAQRSTILVHQKSPLLVATPPQITRALAYSYPFIIPLNRLAGLLSWTTGDPWESFLLVAAFWAVTLYGDTVIRWAGPVVLVAGLILGMYSRRYSLLSSTSWTGEKGISGHKRGNSDVSNTRHHRSLDEIVDELKLFTSRCNILLDPALRLTDFLSTQRTATSATTRPALTAMFIRILFVSPLWFVLTLPPFYFITTKRVVLAIGTISLTWHCRPARVARTILWRSRTIRRTCTLITGLQFTDASSDGSEDSSPPDKGKNANEVAASLAVKRKHAAPGIRFTFTLYENQRRWLGIGWTSSMLAYERASWTDEELNASPSKEQFELPEVEGGYARWRWVDDSQWRVDGVDEDEISDDEKGWVYYDSKWRNGRRDKDGWGRYTRRRKWCRDAELVEITPSTEITPSPTPKIGPSDQEKGPSEAETQSKPPDSPPPEYTPKSPEETASLNSANSTKKRRWFRRSSGATTSDRSAAAGSGSGRSVGRRDEEEEDVHSPLHHKEQEHDWGFGDDARMALG